MSTFLHFVVVCDIISPRGVIMYIRKNIGAKGRIYLSLVHGYRDVNGCSKQKLIENSGFIQIFGKCKYVFKKSFIFYEKTHRTVHCTMRFSDFTL